MIRKVCLRRLGHVFEHVILIQVVDGDLGSALATARLQLCHGTRRILLAQLRQHGGAVLRARALLAALYRASLQRSWRVLLAAILGLARHLAVHADATLCAPVTRRSRQSVRTSDHLGAARLRHATFVLVLRAVQLQVVQAVAALLVHGAHTVDYALAQHHLALRLVSNVHGVALRGTSSSSGPQLTIALVVELLGVGRVAMLRKDFLVESRRGTPRVLIHVRRVHRMRVMFAAIFEAHRTRRCHIV